jgi:release factor glutamine methyltransferase
MWMAGDECVRRLRAAGCVFAEDEADLMYAEARSAQEHCWMVEQRESGLPLELVLGYADLCGIRLRVGYGVFVPRRRSELLVREASQLARATDGRPVVVDLCCGGGGVGVALATLAGDVELHASDIDQSAVNVATQNVRVVGGAVYQGDLYDALPGELRGRVDVLVANAPYVPSDEVRFLPQEARDHEPRMALDGGVDGVEIQRRVVTGAREWLAPGGHLLVETSSRQVPLTVAAFEAAGFAVRVATDDDLEATVVVGS